MLGSYLDFQTFLNSMQGLIKALNVLDEKYGKIHVDFGDPISVRDFMDSHMFQISKHNMGPLHLQNLSDEEMTMIRVLSYYLVRRFVFQN